MYLSEANSISDAAKWLSENSGEPWTWKNVLEMFAKTKPETISVVIQQGTKLRQSFPTIDDEIVFRNSLTLQVCDVQNFLADMLMGNDVETASAHPLALVGSHGYRFHTVSSIPACSLRLHKNEVYGLAEQFTINPFHKLVTEVRNEKYPELTALIRTPEGCKSTSSSSAVKQENPLLPNGKSSSGTDAGSLVHKLRSRVCQLSAEIELAKKSATDPYDVNSVWTELTGIALAEKGPFTGALSDGGGLCYTKDGKVVRFLKKNLRDRMRQGKRKAMASFS